MNITLQDVEQAAKEQGIEVLKALTMMQAGAAKIGDEDALDQLCIIKEGLLDLDIYPPEID